MIITFSKDKEITVYDPKQPLIDRKGYPLFSPGRYEVKEVESPDNPEEVWLVLVMASEREFIDGWGNSKEAWIKAGATFQAT